MEERWCIDISQGFHDLKSLTLSAAEPLLIYSLRSVQRSSGAGEAHSHLHDIGLDSPLG